MTTVFRTDPAAPRRAVRASVPALASGTRLAASTLLGALGVRPFRDRVLERRSTLNETLPAHSKWWREHSASDGDLLYVAIGDSAAQGIGASSPDRSYVGLLAEQVRDVTGRSIRVVNLSVSGATTGLAVRDQLPRFRTLEPDLVTVAIGANDIADWDPTAFDRDIRSIFAALPAHAIVADLPCFHLRHHERKVAVANRMLRAIAREHGLTVVPLHDVTRRRGLRGILTEFANDMFHPNDHGYRVWAEAFRPALGAYLPALGACLPPTPQKGQRMSGATTSLGAWPAPPPRSDARSAAGAPRSGPGAAPSASSGAPSSTSPSRPASCVRSRR